MTRVCTVCTHKKIDEINKLLLEGNSYRGISRKFFVSEDAVERHYKSNHIPEALLKSKEITDLANAGNLARYLTTEHQDINSIKEAALKEGNSELALKAVDRSLKTIEIAARIAGLIQEQHININNRINIHNQPQFVAITSKIIQILDQHPDAKREVIDALRRDYR